jgi:hypothetical protein
VRLGDLNAQDPAPNIFFCFFLTITGRNKGTDFYFFQKIIRWRNVSLDELKGLFILDRLT